MTNQGTDSGFVVGELRSKYSVGIRASCLASLLISLLLLFLDTTYQIMLAPMTISILAIFFFSNKTQKFGIITAVLSLLVYHFLPLLQGSFMYGSPLSDSLYHLSEVRHIFDTGHVNHTYYSGIHVLISELAYITNIELRILQSIIASSFHFLFLLGIFVYAKSHHYSRQAGVWYLLAAIPMVFESLYMFLLPWFQALLIAPILLVALSTSSNRAKYTGHILLLLSISFHILTSIILFTIYTIYAILLDNRFRAKSEYIIVFILFSSVWIYSVIGIDTIGLLVQRTLLADQTVAANQYAESAQSAGHSIKELLRIFLSRYLSIILYLIIGCLSFLMGVYNYAFEELNRSQILYSFYFLIGFFVFLFLFPISGFTADVIRASQLLIFSSIFLVGFSLWSENRESAKLIILAVVIITAAIGFGNAYQPDSTIEHETISGADWFLEHREAGGQTHSLGLSYNLQLFLGHSDSPRAFFRKEGLPDQMLSGNTYSRRNKSSIYLLTQKSLIEKRDWDSKSADTNNRYNYSDTKRLENTNNIDKIYANGDFTTWKIK
jgi:hypothetical protein